MEAFDTSWILQRQVREKGWDYATVNEDGRKVRWYLHRTRNGKKEQEEFKTEKAFKDFLEMI